MIGTWKGKYKYNLKQNSKFNNKEVQFLLEITEFDGEKFIGTVQDEDTEFGTKGQGIIEGKLNGDHIEFIKQMPVRTMLLKNGKKIEAKNKKHHPIYYTGTSNMKDSFSGQWKIKAGISFTNMILYISFGTKGTWEITKIE